MRKNLEILANMIQSTAAPPANTKYKCCGPPAFKSQTVRYQSNQKNIEHSKNQLIHIFTLDIQQILGSHELKDHGYFDHAHSEIIHSTFSSPEFAPPFKRFIPSVHS